MRLEEKNQRGVCERLGKVDSTMGLVVQRLKEACAKRLSEPCFFLSISTTILTCREGPKSHLDANPIAFRCHDSRFSPKLIRWAQKRITLCHSL